MKCNPWRWLWGLVPILVLGWIAILGEREHLEADLTSRTQSVLDRNGFNWASVHFEGRDAVLSGRALDESEAPKAVAAVLDTLGVRVVHNDVSLVDKAVTYEWGALRKDDRIRVNGVVPSDKTRREVIGIVKANFPSLEVDDRMKLARGAPPIDVWMGGVGFGLKQLALLSEGRVELENTSISVRGVAQDVRSYRAVKTALSGQMPQGIRLKSDSVLPPRSSPYTWSARRQGHQWLLDGRVPNDKVREAIVQAARRVDPKAKIADRMDPASGEPDRFIEVARAALVELGRLEEGEARLRDRGVLFKGIAETAEQAEQAKRAMKAGVLMAFSADGEIRHREPAIKTISPYVTTATLEASKVVLGGYVPDEAARTTLVEMTRQRFDGMTIDDRLQIGAGQPQNWPRCVEVGLNALRKLGSGRIALTDRRLHVSGTTEAQALAQTLPGSVQTEAATACETSVQVKLDAAALQAQENARRQAEAAARQQAAEEERERAEAAAQQQAAEEQRHAEAAARQQAEEEQRRAEAAARQQAEEEQRRAEAAARQQAAEEQRRAEAAARQQAEEEQRRAEAAARQQAAEEQRRAEAAAQQQAAEKQRRAEAAARQQAEEEQRRAEAAARQQAAEEEHQRAEAAAQQQAAEEQRRAEAAARQQAEEKQRRAKASARQQIEEQRRRAETAARQKEETERIAKLPAAEKQKIVDVCQEALSRVVSEGVINFNRASYDLDPASYPTLNRVADAANRCPALTVEIEGHTDSEGTDARNQRLSNRRANTVREYLSRAGVEPSRLEAIGFGASHPVASNDTPEGRAKNRRIEFIVKFKR